MTSSTLFYFQKFQPLYRLTICVIFSHFCYYTAKLQKKKTYIYLFQIKITSLSSKMYQLQSLNAAFMRPVYSPRSEMSRYTSDIQKNKTSLAINIDKETLALFKNEYENYDNKIDKINFISIGLKILKSWQKDMQYRQSRLIVYLMSLFEEIQNKVDGIYVTWEEFNNLIIQKALNLKSLQSHDSEAVSQLKHVVWSKGKYKPLTPVKKIVCINHQKKIAILCEESNKIEFLSMVPTQQYLNFKPLVLERQDLTVEKTLVKRVKNQGSRAVVKQNYKKKVVVSGYSVTFIDMIYVSSERYEMLLTSSTDCIIRGWDLHGTTPTLAKQPENQQQKMTHQFSVQIHCMAWDQINDVLYCSANDSKIYLWMVKTDTEKQISDPEGHRAMISSMIMIPKLQFLATGDYDGKLILWDTISLTKKYKYQQHTRSIVSMTFHEALILLFTAAFDHSICVWNPYIPSLIYKIFCNSNVLQVQIIPGTNYLAALDQDSNLRIRQISKFNLISTYVVDRPDENDLNDPQDREGFNKIQPTCMAVSDDPIRFYFGGHSIKCRQFDENQALVSSQHYPIILKYHSQKMKLYVIIKNSILIWDILTGQLYDILQSQADQQITSIDIIQNSGRFIVGDSQGSIFLRKLENGIKISRIYKHRQKVSVNHLLSRRGGIWNESVVIGCCSDGEIVVLGKDQSNDIALLRNFNIRKHFPNVNILSMQYEQKRNLLILGTNTGDIICMDVDKNRITNHISAQSLEAIKFYIKFDIPSLVTFGKNGEILGVYLPPHSKKFKPACNLYVSSSKLQQKIISIAMCKLSKACFMGFENGTVAQILLSDSLLNNQQTTNKQVRKVQSQWEVKFADTPKDMILIIDETVLAVILYMKNITLMSAKNGEVLNVLPSYAYTSKPNFYENPLFYYSNSAIHQRTKQGKVDKSQEKEKLNYLNNAQRGINHQIYVPQLKKYHNIEFSNQIQDKKQLRIFHDPFFLASQYKKLTNPSKKEQKNQDSSANFVDENELNRVVWNKEWKIFANFKDLVDRKLDEIVKTKQECLILIDKPVKRMTRNNSVSNAKNVQRAVEVRQNWEKVKQQLQDDNQKTKSKLLSLSSFKIPNGSSFYSKKIGQTENKLKEEANEKQKHKSLYKNESSPYIRLGLALQKINEHDEKAVKFIELGQKTKLDLGKSLKLPKINTRQQRY